MLSSTPFCPQNILNLLGCGLQGVKRVPQGRSKALHLSAKGVTTDPGSIPGCITTGSDWQSHTAAHNWPSVVRVRVWLG
jgi:hypothetical protein